MCHNRGGRLRDCVWEVVKSFLLLPDPYLWDEEISPLSDDYKAFPTQAPRTPSLRPSPPASPGHHLHLQRCPPEGTVIPAMTPSMASFTGSPFRNHYLDRVMDQPDVGYNAAEDEIPRNQQGKLPRL